MIVLWTGKRETEMAPYCTELRRWRWALLFEWHGISLDEQVQHGEAPWSGGKCRFVFVGVWHWLWGSSHIYYDGPHCAFGIGWLQAQWSLDWCTKCMPTEFDDPRPEPGRFWRWAFGLLFLALCAWSVSVPRWPW